MKRSLLDILACPMCKAALQLHTESAEGDSIISGTLRCTQCGETYKITDGIPDLLPKPPRR